MEARKAKDNSFESAGAALACLPCATAEFALATKRLDNASKYYSRGEAGAANFELTLLQQSLAWKAQHGQQ